MLIDQKSVAKLLGIIELKRLVSGVLNVCL